LTILFLGKKKFQIPNTGSLENGIQVALVIRGR
jgi:hypothetical protein